jgi:hypothetical protein
MDTTSSAPVKKTSGTTATSEMPGEREVIQ